MIRTINEILGDFADKIGYNYASGIEPSALLNGTLPYPAIFWVLPNGAIARGQWRFKSALFIVRFRETGESEAESVSVLQNIADSLRAWLIEESRNNGRDAYITFDHSAMTAEPRMGYDNSGADAMEVSLTFYATKCE